jgi:DNA transposition AAA+ family ATPase
MNRPEILPALDPAQADLREILRLVAAGKPVTDPALRRRIEERAEAARRAMLQRDGVTDIAVDLIREGRDDD